MELAEKLPEEIINYINETVNQIPIESYYYGTRQPDEEIPGYDGRFAVKVNFLSGKFLGQILAFEFKNLNFYDFSAAFATKFSRTI